MDSAEAAFLSPAFIRNMASRREGIAHEWYIAISAVTSLIHDRPGAIHEFSELAKRIIAFLTNPTQPEKEARDIGESLAALHCIQPSVIEITWKLWTRHVLELAQPSEFAILGPRLVTLMYAMTTGYMERAGGIMLNEQEQIRHALVFQVEKVSQELREYQIHLEEMLDQRTRELYAREEQYRLIAETSIDGIFQTEPAGSLTFANDAFCKMVGYSREELLGRPLRTLIRPDDQSGLQELKKVLFSSGAVTGEFRLTHRDGHRIDVLTRSVRSRMGDQEVFTGFVSDITDAKRTEDALRASEALYRTLAEASNDMISLVNPRGEIAYANTSSARQFGAAPRDLVGKRLADFFPAQTSTRQQGNIQKAHESGRPLHVEEPIDFGGKTLWLSTWLLPIKDQSDQADSVLVVSHDITEKKRTDDALRASEERYRTLAESARDLILTIDREHRIIYINSFAAEYIGAEPDQVTGRPSRWFFREQSGKMLEPAIDSVFYSATDMRLEEQLEFKSGLAWLSLSLVPLRDASGSVDSVLVLAKDISELKGSEQALLLAKSNLEQRVQERTASLAASQKRSKDLARQVITAQEEERRRLARELHDQSGQALVAIEYEMDSILKELPKDLKPARRRISKVMASIDQTLQQIRGISQELRPPILDVAGINLSLKEFCSDLAEKTSLAIEYDGSELQGLDPEIGISLFRIVQELLTNVLKHAQATTATVNLKHDEGAIVLKVQDNGKGIKKGSAKAGLGLLGIQERLDILGGNMAVISTSGHGTKITVSIPWQ